MSTLKLHRITKKYPADKTAVADLDLVAEDGELLVLLGPSGSGKTTILRLIAGLTQPTAGDILFDGRSILHLPPEKRGAVMVFQDHSLFPFMSVGDNVAFGLKQDKSLSSREIRGRVSDALSAVQLPGIEKQWPDELSGGQRQRVALARALVVRPRFLLLDEPLSNLDRGLRQQLREMICHLQRDTGITMLFVTHDQTEAVAIADRIALLMNGRLRQVGSPRAFYEKPADGDVAKFFGATNLFSGIKRGDVVETPLGLLHVPPSQLGDGRVALTIWPEAVEMGPNGYNNLAAEVQTFEYMGHTAHCRALINGTTLEMTVPRFTHLVAGQNVTLHLPRERICLLPTIPAEP